MALDLWRNAITPEQTQAEADFLEKILRPRPGARLLDVPCGNGRLSVELARRGYSLTGLDISQEFLEEARSQAKTQGLSVKWLRQDMCRLRVASGFDGAFCMGNSFGYFDAEGTAAFLSSLRAALKPHSRFVINTGIAAECLFPHLATNLEMKVGDILMKVENHYRTTESRLDTAYTFIRNGKSETRNGSQWVFTTAEIQRMLRAAGFHTLTLFESVKEEPFQLGSRELILVAEKQTSKSSKGRKSPAGRPGKSKRR